MDKPLISVIVPVYNVEKYLNECIHSIINQTYKNIEIILVDDGSTDSSGVICDEWKAKDSRISLVHKANGGLADARNTGIEISRGVYIVFVDSDDTVHPEYVEYLHRISVDNAADIGICEIRMLTEAGKEINHFCDDGAIVVMNQEEALHEMCAEKLFSCSACAKIYSREVFRDVRYPVDRLFEDLGTTYKLFFKANKIVFGQRALYNYFRHEGTIMTSSFSWRRMDAIVHVENLFSDVTSVWPGLYGICKKRMFVEYVYMLRTMHLSGITDKKMLSAFDELFVKMKGVRCQAIKNGLSSKMLCYALVSYLGKTLFKVSVHIEDYLYRNLKLK